MKTYRLKIDRYGNKVLVVRVGNERPFRIQTLWNLIDTHEKGIGSWTDCEVSKYVSHFGTARQKALLGGAQ